MQLIRGSHCSFCVSLTILVLVIITAASVSGTYISFPSRQAVADSFENQCFRNFIPHTSENVFCFFAFRRVSDALLCIGGISPDFLSPKPKKRNIPGVQGGRRVASAVVDARADSKIWGKVYV